MKTLIKCQVPKRLIYILALSKHFLQRNGEFKNLFLYISKSFLSTVRGAELFQSVNLTITFSILLTV